MIITLVKADFSAKNIGTLNSFSVLTNVGLGYTYQGPTLVEKNGSFTATLILQEGYGFDKDAFAVQMGGSLLSNCYNQNGNVITINIAKVTGIIVITAYATKVEYDGGDDNENNDNITDTTGVDYTPLFTWTPGTITYKTGGTSSADTNWLYSNMINIEGSTELTFTHCQTPNTNTSLGYAFYDEKEAWIDGANNGGVDYVPVVKTLVVPEGAKYFRCMWINTTSANYNAAVHDISNFYCHGNGVALPTPEPEIPTPEPEIPVTPPEISGDLIDSVSWIEGKGIQHANGAVRDDANWKCTDFIDVSGCNQIEATVVGTTTAVSTVLGYALYDEGKNKITGVMNNIGQPNYNYTLTTIDIPENVKYVRFTWFSANHTNPAAAALEPYFAIAKLN